MGTKLKNSNKKGRMLVIAVLIISTAGMLLFYPVFSNAIKKHPSGAMENSEYIIHMLNPLTEGNYLLYNEISKETDQSEVLEEYGDTSFYLLKKYLEYDIFDKEGANSLLETDETVQKKLKKSSDTNYAIRAAFSFDSDGELSGVEIGGTQIDKRNQYWIEKKLLERQQYYAEDSYKSISTPYKVEIIYGMTQENLDAYMEENELSDYTYIIQMMQEPSYIWVECLLVILTALSAFWIPFYAERSVNRDLKEDVQKQQYIIFQCPIEIVAIIAIILMSAQTSWGEMVWRTINHDFINTISGNQFLNDIISYVINAVVWFAFFAAVYWIAGCLREVFIMKKAYFKKHSLCVKFLLWLKNGGRSYSRKVKEGSGGICGRIKNFCEKQYEALLHLDFQDKTNQTILRIVLINFVIIFFLSLFWIHGIWASALYSIGLFIFLRKYFNKIQEQYKGLLQSTNELAEGKLDLPIEGDVGIFTPIQQELKRIQTGFKKAVDEEVKSERMKTDLITNVSHDLKTPLTAIITYIDLVKNETDEEKRREYIEVLERKSLRLKVLIEDLFEISKATSRNVTLHYMKIDIVDLLKQVGLEYDNNIQKANLEMKWNLPEHKIVLWLDSQKTYRIFENMIVNIVKYAMPHTRVYIDMAETEKEVRISMKNVSAAELNFNTEEITDRFVRGDVSRNTEGSGLGLAIVKSFVELQHGTLKISTEADLYKAEIIFPKIQEVLDERADEYGVKKTE